MSWTSETNIKGPKGDKGDQGIPGPPGTSGTGTGNVTGPVGAVADRIAVYNGTTGTVIKDGGKTIAELGGSAASGITVTPAGNIAATNVQAALVELDNEKVAKAGDIMTGNLIVNKSNPSLALQKTASGQTNQLVGYNDINARWQIQMGDSAAETGTGNAGSNFVVARYTDAGAPIDAPLAIARSTGVVDFKTTPTVSGVPLGSGGGTVYMQDTPPVGAPDKSMWFETDTGMLFGRYNDGNSAQWVHVPGGIADAVRYATAQSLTSAQASQARANIWVTKKNYIINGGMMISQENGTTAGATSAYYPVDMFLQASVVTLATTIQQIVSLTPGGSPNRIRVTYTGSDAAPAATHQWSIRTYVEGIRTVDLGSGTTAPKTITIQFGVKAPTGTYHVSVQNAAQNRSYPASYVIAAGENNIEVVKSVTITLDNTGTWVTDNTAAGMYIFWPLVAGSNRRGTANTWQAGEISSGAAQINFIGTAGNVFELFDVSLTEGTVAPPFQLPDYPTELALCERYLFAPQSGGGYGYVSFFASGTVARTSIPFRSPMRVAPGLITKNISLISVNWLSGNNTATSAALGPVGVGACTVDFTCTGTAFTTGGTGTAGIPAGSILFTARL